MIWFVLFWVPGWWCGALRIVFVGGIDCGLIVLFCLFDMRMSICLSVNVVYCACFCLLGL